MQQRTVRERLALVAIAMLLSACATGHQPLTIQEQGSFAVGGTVVTAPGTFDPIRQGAYNPAGPDSAGQTLHGDHAYVFYEVPANARKLPRVFWHGHGQSGKTWETTPDGREGFQTIFLRRRFPVYVIDQPRRGRAARSTQSMNGAAAPDEQLWFGIFRLGYPRHTLAKRRARMANRGEESERARDRFVRAGRRFHLPGGRGADGAIR